jgi:integrase
MIVAPGSLASARRAEQEAVNSTDPWISADAEAERWLRDPELAESTREQYRLIWNAWRAWCIGIGEPPFTAVRSDFEAYTEALRTIGNPAARKPRPISRRSIVRHMAVISSFYDRAIDDGKAEWNPVPKRRPKVSRESRQPHLAAEDLRRLIAQADQHSPRASALVALLVLACLRVSEALSANVEDLTYEAGVWFLRVKRKGDAVQKVVVAPEAYTRLRGTIGERKAGGIILAPLGGRLDRKSAWTLIRRLGLIAGILVPIGPHTLRHAYITRGHEMGLAVDQLQQAAGHAHVDTTRGYDRSKFDPERHPSFKIAKDLVVASPGEQL